MNQLRPELTNNTPNLEDLVDLRKYWNIVWREKWGIAGLVFLVSALCVLVLQQLTPVYRSSATLLIEAKAANVVSIEEVYGIDSSQREYFATQFEILNSRQLAEAVISRLELHKHSGFDPNKRAPFLDVRSYIPFLPPRESLDDVQVWRSVVDQFQKSLLIQPIRNTQLVKISFESEDPEVTHQVANALGNAYIESDLESRLALTQKAADWLTERLQVMQDDLEKAEQRLQAYREGENLVDLSGVETLAAKEVDETTQRLVAARDKAQETRSQFDAVGNIRVDYDERWEILPGVLSDGLAQRLKENETNAMQETSELSLRYGPKHPNLISAQSKQGEAEQAYRAQVRKVVSGFEEEYRQAQADLRELEDALNRSKVEIQNINRKRYELSQLEREVSTSRQLHDLFLTRFKETNTADFEAANARFVDRAVYPFVPFKPRKLLTLIIAMIVAGTVGVALAFLKDLLDNTIKAAHEVEGKLDQPVIGVLPRVRNKKNDEIAMSEALFDSNKRAFAEAVRTARTNVVLSGIDNPLNRIVVTSSTPGEGKTTLAMNLAFAFGQLEKIVLLDGDMRRPSVAENCGLEHRSPGLSNVIAETCSIDECIYQYRNIDVLPAGVVPPNPLELLSSNRFEELLLELARRYDRIIVDSAPTQAVSDSLVLSRQVDGVIYVVKSDSNPTQVARSGIQRLMRVQSNLLGVMLNQFDPSQASQYGSYGKDYYEYYGYGSKKAY